MTTPLWTESYDTTERSSIVTKLDGRLHEGYVMTADGTVIVTSRWWLDGNAQTELEMIHNQRLWVRLFDRQFQPRYLVTLCKQFAGDVAQSD